MPVDVVLHPRRSVIDLDFADSRARSCLGLPGRPAGFRSGRQLLALPPRSEPWTAHRQTRTRKASLGQPAARSNALSGSPSGSTNPSFHRYCMRFSPSRCIYLPNLFGICLHGHEPLRDRSWFVVGAAAIWPLSSMGKGGLDPVPNVFRQVAVTYRPSGTSNQNDADHLP